MAAAARIEATNGVRFIESLLAAESAAHLVQRG
jgi:hypothetical protein